MAESKQLLGKYLANKIKDYPAHTPINEVEFSVYSQFGEDGIIQFLTHHLRDVIKHKIFVEIGVQNYTEANTRFLLENNAWRGILIDSCTSDIDSIKTSDFYWRNDLHAINSFVTRENINDLLNQFQLPEEIGLFSIDIDGNDYWVLEQMTALKPVIIVLEYNSFFGSTLPISIPYRENFVWRQFHPAAYHSASLPAYCYLLDNKGYEFVGANMAGNNAFFIRKDINLGKIPPVSCESGYRPAIYNNIPCSTPQKFHEQVQTLKYQQVINVIDNSLLRFNGEWVNEFNHINDFLNLDHDEFVNNAYRYILCREPDLQGFNHFKNSLVKGNKKFDILKDILFSNEGKNVDIKILEMNHL